jgi:hypothetical protein
MSCFMAFGLYEMQQQLITPSFHEQVFPPHGKALRCSETIAEWLEGHDKNLVLRDGELCNFSLYYKREERMQLPPCLGQGPAHLLTISFASAGPKAGTTPFQARLRVRKICWPSILYTSHQCHARSPIFNFSASLCCRPRPIQEPRRRKEAMRVAGRVVHILSGREFPYLQICRPPSRYSLARGAMSCGLPNGKQIIFGRAGCTYVQQSRPHLGLRAIRT